MKTDNVLKIVRTETGAVESAGVTVLTGAWAWVAGHGIGLWETGNYPRIRATLRK